MTKRKGPWLLTLSAWAGTKSSWNFCAPFERLSRSHKAAIFCHHSEIHFRSWILVAVSFRWWEFREACCCKDTCEGRLGLLHCYAWVPTRGPTCISRGFSDILSKAERFVSSSFWSQDWIDRMQTSDGFWKNGKTRPKNKRELIFLA